MNSILAGMCIKFKKKRSKRRKRSSIQCFGDDILINILSRLPAECVLQCRRVCKRWKNLTSTSDFIDLQHKLSKPLVLVVYNRKNIKSMLSTDDETTAELTVTPVCKYMTYLNNQKVSLRPEILSSCHGLILYRDVTSKTSIFHDHFICNPVTHEKITLPSNIHRRVCGFYFDPSTKEHRVLHYFRWTGKNHYNYSIYSLEKNSWRDLPCFSHDIPYAADATMVNGSLHWFAKELGDAKNRLGRVGNLCANLILRFNINSESIDTIPHPENQSCSGKHDFTYEMQLVEADRKLCLCTLVREPFLVINRWILEEDCNNKKWVRKSTFYIKWIFKYYTFPFGTSDYNIRIVGIHNSVALLLWEGCGLFSHDIRQETVSAELEVDGKYGKSDIFKNPRVIIYKKSLVSLKHSLQLLKGKQVKGKEW